MLPPFLLIAAMAAMIYGFARQLSRPRGWFGRTIMGSMLNQGNRRIIESAVKAIGAMSGDRIVDVGFGGGSAFEQLAAQVAPARAVGVELSDAMIEAARQKFGDTVELHKANGAAMPFDSGSVDGILSVNTIYFWSDPGAVLREFHRVLKPQGRLVLGIRKKEYMQWSPLTWSGFRLYSSAELEGMLKGAGFDTQITTSAPGELTVVARKQKATLL